MDDFAKQASSYQLDQEILDARGINMTVEEVAGLPTCKYSERVHSLHLPEDDLMFLKGLRRRIKNRLASQNSRRRSTEQLRRLARELRALRASRHTALTERRALIDARGRVRARCQALRDHVVKVLNDRSDPTEVPELEPERYLPDESHSDSTSLPSPPSTPSPVHDQDKILQDTCLPNKLLQDRNLPEKILLLQSKSISDQVLIQDRSFPEKMLLQGKSISEKVLQDRSLVDKVLQDRSPVDKVLQDRSLVDKVLPDKSQRNIFECRIEKLVQQSVNHIYKEKKKVTAKTVFLESSAYDSNGREIFLEPKAGYESERGFEGSGGEVEGVLNLSLKRRTHGRKQTAPRRIACVYADNDDVVLDLKIKKGSQ